MEQQEKTEQALSAKKIKEMKKAEKRKGSYRLTVTAFWCYD